MKVAVLGPLGTYTHEAAFKIFGENVEYDEQRTIADVFHALSSTVQLGVVPQENSIFGNVIETYDVLRKPGAGFIVREVILKVEHCLLARRGTKLGDIHTVMSHEQALGQCQSFLKTHLPTACTLRMPSTASAARALLDNPTGYAAICSRICVAMFNGLEILCENIQSLALNYTRFFVVAVSQDVALPNMPETDMPMKALLRMAKGDDVTQGSSTNSNFEKHPRNILELLRLLELEVSRIDRRPSLDGTPFRDVYFVEVEDTRARSMGGTDAACWAVKVDSAIERVRKAGGHGDLAGLW